MAKSTHTKQSNPKQEVSTPSTEQERKIVQAEERGSVVPSTESTRKVEEVRAYARSAMSAFMSAKEEEGYASHKIFYALIRAHESITFPDNVVITDYTSIDGRADRKRMGAYYDTILINLFGVNNPTQGHKTVMRNVIGLVCAYIRKGWGVEDKEGRIFVFNPTKNTMVPLNFFEIKKVKEVAQALDEQRIGGSPAPAAKSDAHKLSAQQTMQALQEVNKDRIIETVTERIDSDFLQKNTAALLKLLDVCENAVSRLADQRLKPEVRNAIKERIELLAISWGIINDDSASLEEESVNGTPSTSQASHATA